MPRLLTRLLTGATVLGVLASGAVAAAAPAAAAPAGPEVGVQVHAMWSDYTDAQREQVMDQLVDAGATWVRIDMGWATLQPRSRDEFDPWGVAFGDRVIEMAHRRGLKPLITLWATPGWANGGQGTKVLPTDPADYAHAAQWAAARWAGKVAAWEVWNEANSTSFMAGADPVAYTQLLKAAYPAFKAGDPQAKVVFSGTEYNDDRWIAAAYAAGAKGSFDVMATHPYQGVHDAAPEAADDGTKWTLRHAAAVHRLMVANGDGDKPLWFTEFGWTSHGNSNAGLNNWDRGVTEQQQGEYLVRTLELLAAEMPYVTNVFWFTDRNRSSGNPRTDNYGLMRYDLTPKPALLALKSYLTGTQGPTAARAVATPVTAPAPVSAPRTAPVSAAAPATAPVQVTTQPSTPRAIIGTAPTTTTRLSTRGHRTHGATGLRSRVVSRVAPLPPRR